MPGVKRRQEAQEAAPKRQKQVNPASESNSESEDESATLEAPAGEEAEQEPKTFKDLVCYSQP
jgi:hypothetical protein